MQANPSLLVFAALNGAMAVAVGAFGAHGAGAEAKALLTTGGQYQMVHAVLAVALAMAPSMTRIVCLAGWLAATGGLIFCTALLLLGIADLRFMGAIAPVGGTLMIAGWLVLAWNAVSARPALSVMNPNKDAG